MARGAINWPAGCEVIKVTSHTDTAYHMSNIFHLISKLNICGAMEMNLHMIADLIDAYSGHELSNIQNGFYDKYEVLVFV